MKPSRGWLAKPRAYGAGLLVVLLGCSFGCVPYYTPRVRPASRQTVRSLLQRPVLPPEFAALRKEKGVPAPKMQLAAGSEVCFPMKADAALPMVWMEINSRKTPWIIDTGAAASLVLDAESAEKAGLGTVPGCRLTGSGVGGRAEGALGYFQTLAVRGKPLSKAGFASVLFQAYEFQFAGFSVRRAPINLMGLRFLEQFSYVSIDPSRREVRMGYRRPFLPPKKVERFAFHRSEDRLWVDLKYGGMRRRVMWDTGFASSLRIPPEMASHMEERPKGSRVSLPKRVVLIGVGGMELDTLGETGEVALGSLRYRSMNFQSNTSCTEAALGWLPFRDARLTLDFKRSCVWVELPE